MSVKRWTCTDDQCLDEDNKGNLVLYTDHLAAVENLQERLFRAEACQEQAEKNQAYAEFMQARAEATVEKMGKHLDKMLLAATWFHEGPYGPSPDIADLHAAREALAALRGENGEGMDWGNTTRDDAGFTEPPHED